MNYNATLYYPTIEFANKEWLWNACLLWDKVYRIVPEGYIPNDRDEIRTLIEDKSVIANIAPEKYATNKTTAKIKFFPIDGKISIKCPSDMF